MKLPLVQIGNSLGIRIPKALLQQCKLEKVVTVTIVNGTLVLSPVNGVRQGWAESFKQMAQAGDDVLIDADRTPSTFDQDEWEW